MVETPLSSSAKKVQEALDQWGLPGRVVELPATTRTAAEAAQAVGCQVGQIAKSLLFKTKQTLRPVLVIASGSNRVNEKGLGHLLGETIGKADADFVREQTGFVIGGVPPIGHKQEILTFVDEDLLQYEQIWAAAGTPFAVFHFTPAELTRIVPGRVINVK